MGDALAVLLLVGALGVAGLPLTRVLLAGLPGAGAGIARPLALLLAGLVVWLPVSAGIGSATPFALWLGFAFVAVLGVVLHLRRPRDVAAHPSTRALVVGSEVAFVVFFVLGCVLTSYAPDVFGTEKPSDMMLLNATMASDHFPPQDLWLAGQDVNYYYFGSYLVGIVGKALGLAPDRTYNLGIGLTFGLSASAVFGVAGALAARVRPRRAVLGGAIATLFTILASSLAGLKVVLDHDGPLRELPWFDASRVTPGGIDDFPFFATMLGDLHAHLLAIPFVLVGVAFAWQAWVQGPLAGPRGIVVARTVLTGLVVGALYAMHSWNVPGAVGLLVAAGAGWWWRSSPRSVRGALTVVGWLGAVALSAILTMLPFLLNFEPGTDGTGGVSDRQDLWHLLGRLGLTQGVLLGIGLLALAVRARVAFAAVLALALLLGVAGSSLAGPALLLGSAVLALVASARGRDLHTGFALVLLGAALVSLLLPELVYVKDAFDGTPYERQNTSFKFGFGAWVLLGAGAGALLASVWSAAGARRAPRIALGAALVVAAAASLVYVYAGPYARNGGFDGPAHLGGMRWLQQSAPGDVAAIRWLRANAARDAVVLEAAGPDYSTGGRIAMFTGRATVIAWAGHHLVWNQEIGQRETEVATVYGGADLLASRAIVDRYGIDYVVVGAQERTTYPGAGIENVAQLGRRVFAAPDGTAVYRVS